MNRGGVKRNKPPREKASTGLLSNWERETLLRLGGGTTEKVSIWVEVGTSKKKKGGVKSAALNAKSLKGQPARKGCLKSKKKSRSTASLSTKR